MKSILNVCIDTCWYSEIFTNLTGLNISTESIIPTWICNSCENNLLNFHKFRLKCIESDTVLNAIFSIKEEENAGYLCEYLETQEQICDSEQLDTNEIKVEYLDYSDPENIKEENIEEEQYSEEKPIKRKRKFLNIQKKSRKCEICDKEIISTANNYSGHVKSHDPDNKHPFKCGICKKAFRNLRPRDVHMQIHENIKRLKCAYCPETFLHYSSKNLHEAKTHTKKKAYKCKDGGCKDKAFYSQSQLILHTKRHHTNDRPFVCTICSKGYVVKGELDNHLITHNDDKRQHQCEICGKHFLRKSSILTHIQKVHIKDERYDCNYCDAKFPKIKLLATHIQDNHREYYACDVCDKTFNNSRNLTSHKYLHKADKKFACPVCPKKKFGANHLLRRHIRDSHPTIEQPPTLQEIRLSEKLKKESFG